MNAHGLLQPSGPRAWLASADPALAQACPFSPAAANEDELAAALFPAAKARDAEVGRFDAAYVGHVAEPTFRESGSSGGMSSWVAAELLRTGLADAVAHVKPGEPGGARFAYAISRSREELLDGAKSRYYPIELSEVLDLVRATPGRYAVVGIPCFVKATRLLCAADAELAGRIAFTLGLFCGHMKSARFVDSFAWQMGACASEVVGVDYRMKIPERPASLYRAQLRLADGRELQRDWWHMADGDWGAGFFQAPACDFCDDVVAEVADISFGDAWVEPYASDGRGTNVVVARSPLLHRLIEAGRADGRLELQPVDADFVRRTQAAGLRHRREGLRLRLSRRRRGPRLRKRVDGDPPRLPARRKAVYLMRRAIAGWSHRIFGVARTLHAPWLYLGWARASLSLYAGLTYSRGPAGAVFDRLERVSAFRRRPRLDEGQGAD